MDLPDIKLDIVVYRDYGDGHWAQAKAPDLST